jgi:hypothetical protein
VAGIEGRIALFDVSTGSMRSMSLNDVPSPPAKDPFALDILGHRIAFDPELERVQFSRR